MRRTNLLCHRFTSGAPAAMLRAIAAPVSATSSSGTTRFTSPTSLARRAPTSSPVRRISSTAPAPTAASSGAISSYAMVRPSRLIGAPKRLDSPHTAMSQHAVRIIPPPTHSPSTTATVGCGQSCTPVSPRSTAAAYRVTCSGVLRCAPKAPMSDPAEKARPPAPRITTQRTESSRASSSKSAPRPSQPARSSTFSFAGWSSVTVAMPPSRLLVNLARASRPLIGRTAPPAPSKSPARR